MTMIKQPSICCRCDRDTERTRCHCCRAETYKIPSKPPPLVRRGWRT